MPHSSFRSIIQDFFHRNGGWLRLKGELAVYYWPKVAGNEMAKQVVANHFRAGTLYLQTESPALAHQLQMMNLDIIKKYQQLLGKAIVKGIRVKIGTLENKKAPEQPREIPTLTFQEKALIEDCSQKITDPNLAEKFKNLMHRSLVNQHQKQVEGGTKCLSCGVMVDLEFNYCPSCEQKVKEEVQAFLAYQKKNNLNMAIDDLSKITEISHLQIYKR